MPVWAVTKITAGCNRDYEPARQRQSGSIVLPAESVTDAGLGHFAVRNEPYFADTLLIATTSKTTTSAPITVQSHIAPPIHPYAWFIAETLSFGSAVLYPWRLRQSIHTLAQSLSSSLDLAAATMAALRRSRRLTQVLLRTKVEFLFALGAAEVVSLPFMLGSSSGGSRFYVHAANRIFHSRCAIHYDLP